MLATVCTSPNIVLTLGLTYPLTLQEDFPKEFSDVNPCNKLRIEFCEEIARSGEPTDYIYRKEIVLSCPLVYDETGNDNTFIFSFPIV